MSDLYHSGCLHLMGFSIDCSSWNQWCLVKPSTLRVLTHVGLARAPQKEPEFTYLTPVHLQRNKSLGPSQRKWIGGNSRQM